MKFVSSIVLLALTSTLLAGCSALGEDGPAARTFDFTLEVVQGTDNTVPLYTLNDGRTQRVVAGGFAVPGESLTVPNPEIRVREGDTVRLTIVNNNRMPHTFHLHGGIVDWFNDGIPFLTQMPIMQGTSYTYVFEDLKAGSYYYHCHVDTPHHQDLGMYGAFVVEERNDPDNVDRDLVIMLDEFDNCHVHGNTDPLTGTEQNGDISQREGCLRTVVEDNLNQNQLGRTLTDTLCAQGLPPDIQEQLNCGSSATNTPAYAQPREWYPVTFPVYEPEYNTYVINGKAYPDTKPIVIAEGETIRLRLMNIGFEVHTMHLHGHYFEVVSRDGYRLDSPFKADSLGIAPGERYDIIIKGDNPGYWPFHDNNGLAVMNDGQSPGGMLTYLVYDNFYGKDADAFQKASDVMWAAMEILMQEKGDHSGMIQRYMDGYRDVYNADGTFTTVKVS